MRRFVLGATLLCAASCTSDDVPVLETRYFDVFGDSRDICAGTVAHADAVVEQSLGLAELESMPRARYYLMTPDDAAEACGGQAFACSRRGAGGQFIISPYLAHGHEIGHVVDAARTGRSGRHGLFQEGAASLFDPLDPVRGKPENLTLEAWTAMTSTGDWDSLGIHYNSAEAFVAYLNQELGFHAYNELAVDVLREDGQPEIEAKIETSTGKPIDQFLDDFRSSERTCNPWPIWCAYPSADWGPNEQLFRFERAEMSCSDDDVVGYDVRLVGYDETLVRRAGLVTNIPVAGRYELRANTTIRTAPCGRSCDEQSYFGVDEQWLPTPLFVDTPGPQFIEYDRALGDDRPVEIELEYIGPIEP